MQCTSVAQHCVGVGAADVYADCEHCSDITSSWFKPRSRSAGKRRCSPQITPRRERKPGNIVVADGGICDAIPARETSRVVLWTNESPLSLTGSQCYLQAEGHVHRILSNLRVLIAVANELIFPGRRTDGRKAPYL